MIQEQYIHQRQRFLQAPGDEFVEDRWTQSKVRIGATTLSDYRIMLDCYLIPYFGHRKIESIGRYDIEKFRAEMATGAPKVVREAREAKLQALKSEDP